MGEWMDGSVDEWTDAQMGRWMITDTVFSNKGTCVFNGASWLSDPHSLRAERLKVGHYFLSGKNLSSDAAWCVDDQGHGGRGNALDSIKRGHRQGN